MNRDIKFRAYAFASNQMFYPSSEDGWELINGQITTLPNAFLMQSTGIKDRNGVEIWEGDIVNYAVKKKLCDCKDETDLFLGINKFCPDCGKELKDKDFVTTCKIGFRNGSFVLHKDLNDGYYQAWPTYIAEIYIEWKEVIGNIHQNPELLTTL